MWDNELEVKKNKDQRGEIVYSSSERLGNKLPRAWNLILGWNFRVCITSDLRGLLKLPEFPKVLRRKWKLNGKKASNHHAKLCFFAPLSVVSSTFHPSHFDLWSIISINRKTWGGAMIHLFILQNLSIILVFEGKWKMSISFKGRYLYSVLLVLKGFFFFFFFYPLPLNHLEASSFKSELLPNSPLYFGW